MARQPKITARQPARTVAKAAQPAPQGYFKVTVHKVQPRDIYFRVLKPGCPPPMQALKHDLERCLSAVQLIFWIRADEARRRSQRTKTAFLKARLKEQQDIFAAKYKQAFIKLLNLACLGLDGPRPAVAEAAAALASLQTELVEHEAGRIKNEHMRRLGVRALVFALAMLAIYALFDLFPGLPSPSIHAHRNILLILAGTAAGTWASFALRKPVLNFPDLVVTEDDRLDPSMRIIFTAVLTFILTLVFITGFADFNLAQFRSANLLASGPTALLFGALAGLSEKALPDALGRRTQALLARLAPANPGRPA